MTLITTDPLVPPTTSLVDMEALAARLGVTVRFVRRMVEERRVPYLKLVRFDADEIEAWLVSHRVGPPVTAHPVRRHR